MTTRNLKHAFVVALLPFLGTGCAMMRPNNSLVDGPVKTGNSAVDTVGNSLVKGKDALASLFSGNGDKGAADNVYTFFAAEEAKKGFVPPAYADAEGKKIAFVPFEGNGFTFKKSAPLAKARRDLVKELDKVGTGSPRFAELAGAIAKKSLEIAETERTYYPIAMQYVGGQIGARVVNREGFTAEHGANNPIIAQIDEDIRFLNEIYLTLEARSFCASVVPDNYVHAEFSLADFGGALDNFTPQPIDGLNQRAYALVQAIAGVNKVTAVPVVSETNLAAGPSPQG